MLECSTFLLLIYKLLYYNIYFSRSKWFRIAPRSNMSCIYNKLSTLNETYD